MPALEPFAGIGANSTRGRRGDSLQLKPSPPPLLRRADGVSTNPELLYDVPEALAAILAKYTGGSKDCEFQLDTAPKGYNDNAGGDLTDNLHICGDSATPTYAFWVANMDVDCDGGDKSSTVCATDPTWLGETRFQDDSGANIDAVNVPYIVVNDQDKYFDAIATGIQPLSISAVVCGGKLAYGVWADSNAELSMGEASLKLAQTCFGPELNGNMGHGDADVLYIAFIGDKATTVPNGAGSDAAALKTMGDAVIASYFGGTVSGGGDGTPESNTTTPATDTGERGDKTTTKKDTTTTAAGGSGATTTSVTPVPTTPVATTPAAQPTSTIADSTSTATTDSTQTYIIVGVCVLLVLLGACVIGYTMYKKHGKHKRLHDKRRRRDERADEEDDEDEEGDETGTASGSGSGSSDDDDDERGLVHGRHRGRR